MLGVFVTLLAVLAALTCAFAGYEEGLSESAKELNTLPAPRFRTSGIQKPH